MTTTLTEGSFRSRILALLTEVRDYPLTVRDLAEVLGTSPGNVRYHLEVLRDDELVMWRPYTSRSLRITDAGRRALQEADPDA